MRLVADGGPVRLTGLAGPVLAAAPTRASATAAETALDAAFPNPFSRTATVPLTLAQAAEAFEAMDAGRARYRMVLTT